MTITHYKLTDEAAEDLQNIIDYGRLNWTKDQVQAYVVTLKNLFNTFVRVPKDGPDL